MDASLGKVPPHSVEAERATLGSILIDKEAMIKVADILTSEDFYIEANSLIYDAIFELFNKHKPIDLLTLASLLEDKEQLEIVGGETYLAELTTEVPTSTHVQQYATIVKHKSTLRNLIKAGNQLISLGYDENEEVDNLLEEAEKSVFNVSQGLIKNKFVHIKDVLNTTFEKVSDLHDPEGKEKYNGIPTGFKGLDKMLSGLQPSDVVILAARPSMGKTAFALNLAQNMAKKGQSVGIISLEMSKEQLVERLFCSMLEVDSWKMKNGQLTEQDFARMAQVMDEMNSQKIFIDDSCGSSIVELRAKARRLQMEHGLDVLVIDYLQLMTGGKSTQGNRIQEISEISRSIKALARELQIPIIPLSQLSRAVEYRQSKVPILSDLRESGSIEQDADVVMMLYREDYYEEDTDRKGLIDIYVRKHRNGPVGHIEMMFAKEKMKFYDIDNHHSPSF